MDLLYGYTPGNVPKWLKKISIKSQEKYLYCILSPNKHDKKWNLNEIIRLKQELIINNCDELGPRYILTNPDPNHHHLSL